MENLDTLLERGVVPQFMLDAPVLEDGLDFYLNAFKDLQYDRQTGFEAGRIPFTAIDRWAQIHELDADDLFVLIHHIREMEAALLEHQKTQSPQS